VHHIDANRPVDAIQAEIRGIAEAILREP
jgi:hypothetical protein